MKPQVFIFVNGILSWPGKALGWTDRAVTFVHHYTGHRAEKFEYWAMALTRRLMQGRRARQIASLAHSYHKRGFAVHLVGHSNGCDLILRALKHEPNIETVNMIAAAADADFERNGLNAAMESGRLRRVTVCVGGKDWALAFARLTRYALAPFGLGYGSLGWTGPENVAGWNRAKVRVIGREDFGHSSWFKPENWNFTMTEITSNACPNPA